MDSCYYVESLLRYIDYYIGNSKHQTISYINLYKLLQVVYIFFALFFLQVDVFKLEAADLGKIYRIKIWHDNKNINPSWYLDYVEVIDTADSNKSYMFHCERWLSKSKDDCKIERSLYVKVILKGKK